MPKEDRLSKNTDAVMAITHCSRNHSSNLVLEVLRDNLCIVLIGIDIIKGGVQFFHHVQEVSGGIELNFKSKVVLQGWGAGAQALLLNGRTSVRAKSLNAQKKKYYRIQNQQVDLH